jgi:uncharacterized protein YraI
MKKIWFPYFVSIPVILFMSLVAVASSSTIALAQQSTATPTSTSTISGMYITVITEELHINVRMGPSSSVYPIIGTLTTGGSSPALGRSAGGDWIKIEFPGAPNNSGWVYSPLVRVSPGTLQVVEPPPTPEQPPTSTIDPTLAAQFLVVSTNTRLPTFTPPPLLTSVTYTQNPPAGYQNSIPLAPVIVALASLGGLGYLLSFLIRH